MWLGGLKTRLFEGPQPVGSLWEGNIGPVILEVSWWSQGRPSFLADTKAKHAPGKGLLLKMQPPFFRAPGASALLRQQKKATTVPGLLKLRDAPQKKWWARFGLPASQKKNKSSSDLVKGTDWMSNDFLHVGVFLPRLSALIRGVYRQTNRKPCGHLGLSSPSCGKKPF